MRWFGVIHGLLLITALLPAAKLCGQEMSATGTSPPEQTEYSSQDVLPPGEPLFSLPPLDPSVEQNQNIVEPLGEAPRPTPKAPAFDSMGPGGRNSGPGYGVTWYPISSRGATDMSLVRQNLSTGMPLFKNDRDSVILTLGVKNSLYDTNAILPESGMLFPEELWNITFGTMFLRKFDNGMSGMLAINFGSASDQPFHSIDEMTLGFISMLQVPARNERDKWQYSLFYSPVGNFNFPMPGIAYQWNPSETFQAAIGLPFSLKWRPTESWTIELNYLPVLNVNARATYRWTEVISFYGGYESFQETYLLANRMDLGDRFVGFEQRLIGGMRWGIGKRGTLDCHAGYAFDRYFGTGQNQIGGGLEDQIDLPSGAFVGANFSLRF